MDPSFQTFDEAFRWLASCTNYETMATQRYDERTYGLHRVQRLLDDLGRPDAGLDAVQIVGSKGKGSTAEALAAILRAAGRGEGLYTSPHLVDPRERIRVDGTVAPDDVVRAALSRIRPLAEAARERGEPCTFFEIHTAAALLAFAATARRTAVLEAGMGGRLDATTAAEVRSVVLTNVSLDHTAHLGRRTADVAREKVAAARPGVPLISGERACSAAGRVIAAHRAADRGPLLVRGKDFRIGRVRSHLDPVTGRARTEFTLLRPGRPPIPLEMPLLGGHQAENGALAAMAALCTPWRDGPVPEDAVRAGLAGASLPARLQVAETAPLVLIDGAHSPASLGRLAEAVRRHVPQGRAVFVVGMARDKDLRGSLRRLAGTAVRVIGTASANPRAAAPAEVAAAAAAAAIPAEEAADLASAIERARRAAGRQGTVVVTGSLYLCGEYLAAAR